MQRVRVSRRPLRRGVGLALLDPSRQPERLLATNEDGFHSNGNALGPLMENTTIEFTGDDSGNICSAQAVVMESNAGARRAAGGAWSSNDAFEAEPCSGGASMLLVDVGHNLRRGKAGDTLSFYHLHSNALQGSVTLAARPTVSHDAAAVAKMRSGYSIMNAPPYSAQLVPVVQQQFTGGFPVLVRTREPVLPPGVEAWWSVAVLSTADNSGARVTGCVFSDSYARAFMVKGRDALFVNNTFRRAGSVCVGPEQSWLEGDPGIADVTVEHNLLEQLGKPAVVVSPVVPSGRDIVVKNNRIVVQK
eukprot:COSAG01_NODE_2517_length_7524_cov_19.201616_5_plen_304_part_00